MVVTLGQQYDVREKPTPLDYRATLTLIAMQGHQTKKQKHNRSNLVQNIKHGSNNILFHKLLVKTTFVCVCVFSSHPLWTSSSLDVPAGVTQEEVHTGFLIHLLSAVRALIFLARRIQPFLSLVDREVEFCVLTI